MKISTLPAYRLLTVIATALVLLTGIPVATQANKPLKFVGVNLNDSDTMNADKKLVRFLKDNTGLDIGEETPESYGRMIRKLLDKNQDELYVARVTPYVYVVAEMMGAEFELLATYKNKSDATNSRNNSDSTYHSWFVVNREYFPELKNSSAVPTLDDLMRMLRAQSAPPKFIYHDKFSTSSYFVPSLEFRSRKIFSMSGRQQNLTSITSENVGGSSSDLVRKIANNEAFLAAVWDGTKNKFQGQPEEGKVYFVQIPTVLPNDLLVCSARIDKPTRERLRTAIKQMSPSGIDIGDFKTWSDINSESEAKEALAALRHSAEQRPAPVTVRIGTSEANPDPGLLAILETTKHAVRLSGTELVPFDRDYHKRPDVDWVVDRIHDGAINLVSKINNTDLEAQQFEISFTDSEDLTKRIGSFIHSRMHRIRYIWPYDDERPTVLRDTDFPISPETAIKVMRITWTDPQRNEFSDGDPFDAQVVNTTPFGFQLASNDFPKDGNRYSFDPMSNVSYRVILVRSSQPGRVFTILTYALVGLLVLCAAGAVVDLRRKAKTLRDVPLVDIDDFKRMCRRLATQYRGVWQKHKLTEADVLWCDRDRLEKLIADLKSSGHVDFDSVRTRTRSLSILANVPVLSKVLGLTAGGGINVVNVTDPAKFSDTQRLSNTLTYLMNNDALSPFISERLEWDALNEIAADVFEPFKQEATQSGANAGGELIRSEHPLLVSLIEKHFTGVIQESKEKVCFFGKKWTLSENGDGKILSCTSDMLTPLRLNGGNSRFRKITLQAQVGGDAELSDLAQSNELDAWLFGKIHRVEPPRNGDGNLVLNFKPAALVRTDDQE
jgi:ABC-type phosphate/phosphonate transport system substrate-binding protein